MPKTQEQETVKPHEDDIVELEQLAINKRGFLFHDNLHSMATGSSSGRVKSLHYNKHTGDAYVVEQNGKETIIGKGNVLTARVKK